MLMRATDGPMLGRAVRAALLGKSAEYRGAGAPALQYSMRMDWASAVLESEAATRRNAVETDLWKRDCMCVPHGANQRERLSSRDDSKIRNEWKWNRRLGLEVERSWRASSGRGEERAAWIEGKGDGPRAIVQSNLPEMCGNQKRNL